MNNVLDIQTRRPRPNAKQKAPAPWFRFFADDWLKRTRGLSAAEFGILMRLLATMHIRSEPLPEDHPRLARICGTVTVNFRHALNNLLEEGFIVRRGSGLWSPAMDAEEQFRRAGNSRRSNCISEEKPIKSMAENDRDSESQRYRDSEVFEGPIKGPSSTSQSTSSESEDRGSRLDGAPPSAAEESPQKGNIIHIDGEAYELEYRQDDGSWRAQSLESGDYRSIHFDIMGGIIPEDFDDVPF